MKDFARQAACVLFAAGLLFFLNLGQSHLWDEDEPKNAECGREMLERGDWIVPTFNYDLRTDKPILVYWWMLAAYRTWGVSEWSARCGSAFLGMATCFLTFLIGRRLYGGQAGLWSGLVLSCTLMFAVISRACTPDATFICCSTLAFWFFVSGVARQQQRQSEASRLEPSASTAAVLRTFVPASPLLWLTYGAMGLAVLAKGPAGWLLPSLVMGIFLLWQVSQHEVPLEVAPHSQWWQLLLQSFSRFFAIIKLRELAGALRPAVWIGIPLAIALPWYAAVGWITKGDWLLGFLGRHNISRFLSPMEGHSGPVLYYVVAVGLGFFPWTSFLIVAIVDAVSKILKTAIPAWQDLFVLTWIGVYLGFFSFSGTKLPNYVLPCYPALAILTGKMLDRWVRTAPHVTPRTIRMLFGGGITVGIIWMAGVFLALRKTLPEELSLIWIGVIPLGVGALSLWLAQRQQWQRAVTTFALGGLSFYLAIFSIVVPAASRHHLSRSMGQLLNHGKVDRAQIATLNCFTPSMVYYLQRQVHDLPSAQEAARFLRHSPTACLVMNARNWEELREVAPRDVVIVQRWKIPFKKKAEEIWLIRRSHPSPETDPTAPLATWYAAPPDQGTSRSFRLYGN